jgi:hypothetical protein
MRYPPIQVGGFFFGDEVRKRDGGSAIATNIEAAEPDVVPANPMRARTMTAGVKDLVKEASWRSHGVPSSDFSRGRGRSRMSRR